MIYQKTIRPDDVKAFDFPFSVTLSSVSVELYDISDNAKTSLTATKVLASNVVDKVARVVFYGLTGGHVYRYVIKGSCTDSNTYHLPGLLICTIDQELLGFIREGERRGFEVGLSDFIPSGLLISDDECTFTAVNYAGDTVDADTLIADVSSVERTVTLSIENCTRDNVYVITGLFKSTLDPLNNVQYEIGKTLILHCEA